MKLDEKFKIEITYAASKEVEIIEIETKDIEWSMGQYQRNRPAFGWKIID
jgi:hypothetical protein